jgi:hypothetical protein
MVANEKMGWVTARRIVSTRAVVADGESGSNRAIRHNPRCMVREKIEAVGRVEHSIAVLVLASSPQPTAVRIFRLRDVGPKSRNLLLGKVCDDDVSVSHDALLEKEVVVNPGDRVASTSPDITIIGLASEKKR